MDMLNFQDFVKMKLLMFDNFLSHANELVIEFLELIYSDAVENHASEEIQDAWLQLYRWANKISGTICMDCEENLTLSTTEEAENLLKTIGPKTTGNENVIWAVRLVTQSFPYWGKNDKIEPPDLLAQTQP